MRFVIGPFAQNGELELAEEEFGQIELAKGALVTMIGIEQKFDLLLANYSEYEQEVLGLALSRALRADSDWRGSQADIAAVARRVTNVLSAARLYVDQVKHDLRTAFGGAHEVAAAVETKMAAEYDSRLGYRAMEALRNVLQHRSLPIDQLAYMSDATDGGARYRVAPRMGLEGLKEGGFKAAVLKELSALGDAVSVTPLLRDYIEGLAAVQDFLRESAKPQVEEWDALIEMHQTDAVARWGGDASRAFLVEAFDASGEAVKSIHLFTELTRYRVSLERKNRSLRGLAHRFVSSQTDRDA